MNIQFPKKLTAAVLVAFMATSTAVAPILAEESVITAQNEASEQVPAKPSGANTMTYDYKGTLSGVVTADGDTVSKSGETISTDTVDQNVALAQNGGTLTLDGVTLDKSGADKNGDNCNFYGINSIGHSVGEGSLLAVNNSTLTADSTGSNALFATDNATIYANNSTITTQAANARGLDATYGGTVIGNLMGISTAGDHSAGVATDRGGGSISLTNSSIYTAGSGSPIAYSTGHIELDNVSGTATGSQIAGMEGLNTIAIRNSDLTSTITTKTASDPVANGVIIYQSTSGDAEAATGDEARFEAVDSTLSSAIEEGSMFYLTNTSANVVLQNTALDFDAEKAGLMTIAGNDANNWGTAGKNGAAVTFTGIDQTLEGDIYVDSASSLNLFLLDGTTYTGAIKTVENEDAASSEVPVDVSVDSTSTWVLTYDTTITNLYMNDGAKIVDEDGKDVTIIVGDETVRKGDSDLALIVTGEMDDVITTTSANALSDDNIDRSDFDTAYAVQTTFGTNEGRTKNTNITQLDRVEDSADEGGQGGGSKPPSLPNEATSRYDDVASDYWAYSDIMTATRAGLLQGTADATFSPSTELNRAMIATILYRQEGEPEVGTSSFSDVSSNAYYAKAVAWAQSEGIVSGASDDSYAPTDKLTREQLATILYRYAAYKGYDTTVSVDASLASYGDSTSVSSYATDAMLWAVDKGIIAGTSTNTLSPKTSATRAQAASILVRFLKDAGAISDQGGFDTNGEPPKPDGDLAPDKPGNTTEA